MTQVPPPTPQPVVPVCYRHPRREAHVRCTRCNRPICPDCMHEASVGHQCPECVADGRRSVRSVRTVFGGTSAGARGWVSAGLVSINTLLLFISVGTGGGVRALFGGGLGGLIGSATPLTNAGAVVGECPVNAFPPIHFVTCGVSDGEFYRLFTYMFLHYGVIHLATNMWALLVVGRALEAVLGPLRFTILYLVAGLGGGVACYVFAPQGGTVGASGAIFGLFAALFVVMRRLGRDTASFIPILVVNLGISFLPGISLAGHLGGLVTGAAIALAMAYAPPKSRTLVTSLTVAGLLIVMGAAVVAQTAALQLSVPAS
jgi:membrane associated rhomboid family serine protease